MNRNEGDTLLSVLHINAIDKGGGSARAAYAVHRGLKQRGVQSRMLVRYKSTEEPDVSMITPGPLRFIDKAVGRGLDHLGFHYLLYPSSFLLLSHPWFREADIVQLYNTHGGYFSHTVLPWLSRGRPVVWRLDDLWVFTGGCNYPGICDRWKQGCGHCPHLSLATSPRLRWDSTALLWNVKDACYARSRLTITAPSRWVADMASQSPLLRRFPIRFIPYGIDTQVFRPIPKIEARNRLGIKAENRVVAFGAQDVADRRKGSNFVKEALERLTSSGFPKTTALIFGSRSNDLQLPYAVEAKRFGPVKDDNLLTRIYSAADVFMMPSMAEVFGLVALESMACGTPVVAFGVDGVTDHVRHMETGYVANNKDAADLASGIERIVADRELYAAMAERCRRMVEEEYTQELQAKRYHELYEDLHKQSLSLENRRNELDHRRKVGYLDKTRSVVAKFATGASQSLVDTRLSRHLPVAFKKLFWRCATLAGEYTVHGSRIALSTKEILQASGKAMICGTYEIGTTRLLMRELHPGMVFVDVGAHIGYYACLAARLVGPRGTVVALEPHPGNAAILRRNVALNGYENVRVIEKAASHGLGKQALFLSDNPGHHSFYPFSDVSRNVSIDVETATLDDLVASLNLERVDLVKIDVEGAEGQVLKGMSGLLRSKDPPRIIVEYNPEREAVAGVPKEAFCTLLKGYGLCEIVMIDDDLRLPRIDERDEQLGDSGNWLCTRATRMQRNEDFFHPAV